MSRLYTYLPKDNTALTEGLLSTSLSPNGWEKYKGRTGKSSRDSVLKVLDSWEPEWTRSKAISALSEPIPSDAAEDFLEFARNRNLYSFDIKDLIKAKILAHLRRTRKGGGTDSVNEVKNEKLNWHGKKKHLLFQGIPHYLVETTGGKIPPELVREEKQAATKIDIPALYEEVRNAYADMGYPVYGDRLVVSEQPTYSNGKPVPIDELSPNESGGNTQHDGTVRINPRYRAVMRHWKLNGPGRDFLRTIIGHELGHHIDRSVLSKPENAEERKRLLREIVRSKFHTVYTDSYSPDTDKRKLDKELLAEYLADMVKHKLEKKAGAKLPTDLATVTSLVKRVLRNKPKPVPLRKIVDAVTGNAVFRGSPREQLPALQIRHAVETLGIPEKKVLVHVSPSVGVVNEYSGTYTIKNPSLTGADRRGGFLQVIRSGLGDIKKGKQDFSADFGAVKSKQVPPSERKITRMLNRRAMDNPYALSETGAFEARLPARSLSDAKVYVTSVKPGFKGVYRKPDYDNIMLTDITDINRLVKIRTRHPEFAKYIDPVISRYTHPGWPMAYSEVKRYLPRNANPFRDPPAWQLPRYLRNLRGTNGRYLFQNIQD